MTMKTALVGSTGFVGGNLGAVFTFDGMYHASDISEAFGTRPQLLVYAGVPSEKYLANHDPEKDLAQIENAFANIGKIAPERLVLISTADVYETPSGVDETTLLNYDNPAAYGRNRALLEKMVSEKYPEALIVRLPALFGKGLKKNFLFDFITRIPAALTKEKYVALCAKSTLVQAAYAEGTNGFYKLKALPKTEKESLYAFFCANDFNALSFTDSRAVYQYYNLAYLWGDICHALDEGIQLLNITTEPVSAAEIYAMLTNGEIFENHIAQTPVAYDIKTVHADVLGGENGYLYNKQSVLADIAAFVKETSAE